MGQRIEGPQITEELHHGYHVEALEDVTVIKDRQTGRCSIRPARLMSIC